MPCYSGPNPVTDEERVAIWRWAKANGIDQGLAIEKVGDAINQHFFSGMARPEWITDILSGRKTPYREVANNAWKAQYNRRAIVEQAKELSRLQSMGPVGKTLRALWTAPRTAATIGHGFVFPITHGGDLALRPQSWATFIKGVFDTYRASFSPAYAGRMLDYMQRKALYTTALRSGLDVGPKSHPSGLITRYFNGPSKRAWDMLTVMRYELWEGQMNKFIKPGMSQAEVLDIGKNLASWANHATGSAKMPIPMAGEVLFGPKLTASKISRIIADPLQTAKTIVNWNGATAGEKAAALTRLSGAAQYAVTYLGFLAVNQGLLQALGLKQNINFTDPTKGDFLQFKAGGLEGGIPGLHTEIRTLARIFALQYASKRQLRGESQYQAAGGILGAYLEGKLTPAIQRGGEILFGKNWMGRPLPWSSDPGTAKKPRMSWGEYLASIGPIPLEGPIGYVYQKLREGGARALDATAVIKGLIIAGLGATGLHVREEPPPPPPPSPRAQAAARALQNRQRQAAARVLQNR